MRPDLKAMIERGARGLYDYDAIDSAGHTWESLPKATQSFLKGAAVACLRSALPGLFTEPPTDRAELIQRLRRRANSDLRLSTGELDKPDQLLMAAADYIQAWPTPLANPIPDAEQS